MLSRSIVLLTVLGAASAWAQIIPANSEFRVKLLAPLNTDINQPGDKISAQVISPPEFAGATVQGEVKQSKSGGKINGKSVLNFTFHELVYGGSTLPISANVQSFVNSKGVQGVDEEGQIIQKKNNIGKAALGTGIGALIGGLAGGAKGAAMGAAAGAAISIVMIQTTASGARVSFAPGSEFTLNVTEIKKR